MADTSTPLPEATPPARIRPSVPVRELILPKVSDSLIGLRPAATNNPFSAIEVANKEAERLNERLEMLAERLAGPVPRFNPPEVEKPPTGLMPLAAGIAQRMAERSRHGVSLIDQIEENLT